jgi:predicted nucleic acid-binding protein
MRLVVDVNIILSALISDSATRKIILNSSHELYFPEAELRNIRKYSKRVLEKTGMGAHEFEIVLGAILGKIEIVKTESYSKQLKGASSIMSELDPDDTPFLALALSIPSSVIWSNDKHLHKQSAVKSIKTGDLIFI